MKENKMEKRENQRKTVLYIGMSLDGFIADRDGGVDWMEAAASGTGDDGYSAFLQTVDTIVIGHTTYCQIVTGLSRGKWPYDGLQAYVITHRNGGSDRIRFTCQEPAALISRLKKESGKDIWICGGADIANQLISCDLIDQYRITVLPVLLGNGIRLFHDRADTLWLTLVSARYSGELTELCYERRTCR